MAQVGSSSRLVLEEVLLDELSSSKDLRRAEHRFFVERNDLAYANEKSQGPLGGWSGSELFFIRSVELFFL